MQRYIILVSRALVAGALLLALAPAGPAQAQTLEDKVRLLEATVGDLLERDERKDATIDQLQEEIDRLRAGNRGPIQKAGKDDHGHAHGGAPDLYSVEAGGGLLRLRGIGINAAVTAGGSSEKPDEIATLNAGHHDPNRNGFTLQTVDLGLLGAYDPYFDAEVHASINLDRENETVFELEEAFLRTQSLPAGFEVEAGQMFTEFGVTNPTHFHQQAFLDQPVVANRMFGPDGARGVGARVGWTAPVPWDMTLHAGVQNANGETMVSFLANDEVFEDRPIGGRAFNEQEVDSFDELVYLGRVDNRFRLGEDTGLRLGGSMLRGANATGGGGHTTIWGADLTLDHRFDDVRTLTWQSEFMHRRYAAGTDVPNGFAGDTLVDYGLYTQLLFGFAPELSAGARFEYASGRGESAGPFAGRDDDPFRDDRIRISPLATWQFAPTGNLRLQYNYDHADHLSDSHAHSIWLGLQWAFGAGEAVHASGGGRAHAAAHGGGHGGHRH